MSIMMLDMTREPLVEMNLGGAEALQGRSAFCQNRSGRHCKRPGVSAHMRETAPGLLQVCQLLRHLCPGLLPFSLYPHHSLIPRAFGDAYPSA
jgi:hypothetical protein